MGDNAFGDALDDVAEEQTADETDSSDATERFIKAMGGDGTKSKTIGFAVSPEMKYFYDELRASNDVDVDPGDEFRDQLERLANRHPEVADKARRKLKIDTE
ncbi:hypothetical protein BDK61_4768 [Haloarcula quadrata]|jgi:hypothetical protein|uniref:Uncharacterized protein n=1 Tax=Haloarcula quadrata TaxID=182779 RepID=A0A495QMW5_9EURY|nr:hypothetical protein [Haloarcula quadrata]RKS74182.1 hypothetical protein BDK61_4768 [Haloarcula quadrata]